MNNGASATATSAPRRNRRLEVRYAFTGRVLDEVRHLRLSGCTYEQIACEVQLAFGIQARPQIIADRCARYGIFKQGRPGRPAKRDNAHAVHQAVRYFSPAEDAIILAGRAERLSAREIAEELRRAGTTRLPECVRQRSNILKRLQCAQAAAEVAF